MDLKINLDSFLIMSNHKLLEQNSLMLIMLFIYQDNMMQRLVKRYRIPYWNPSDKLNFGSLAFTVIIFLGISLIPTFNYIFTSWNFLSGTKHGLILWLCFLYYLWLSSSFVISKLESWAGLTSSVLTSKAKAPKFL